MHGMPKARLFLLAVLLQGDVTCLRGGHTSHHLNPLGDELCPMFCASIFLFIFSLGYGYVQRGRIRVSSPVLYGLPCIIFASLRDGLFVLFCDDTDKRTHIQIHSSLSCIAEFSCSVFAPLLPKPKPPLPSPARTYITLSVASLHIAKVTFLVLIYLLLFSISCYRFPFFFLFSAIFDPCRATALVFTHFTSLLTRPH